uniref:Cytosolic phospholipase A2 gamma-like n=1 Tax=Podarcis muralis TaxID=64176 RepID=A0A670JLW8_PODMU|nr:cytosolic phospholipase A2 gamma-like [Podarcis muralis]
MRMEAGLARGHNLHVTWKGDVIRISRDVSDEEKTAVGRRKIKVHNSFLKLGVNTTMSSVPNVALLGSGGGLRAMIALQGVLGELQKEDLLGAVMYLCGVSGSTWCMSFIYEHEEWLGKLPTLEAKMCDNLVNQSWDPSKSLDALVEPSKEKTYSLTDFWGSVILYAMLHELDYGHLSKERMVSFNGAVPYPIYAAVDSNKLDDTSKTHPGIWFEFTPHDAGFFHSGAFVDMRLLGSTFENGVLRILKNEKDISYLRGLWGSSFADRKEDVKEIEDYIKHLGEQASASSCHCIYCQAASHAIKLLIHAMEGTTHEHQDENITNIMELLKDQVGSNTYNFLSLLKDKHNTLDKPGRVAQFLTLADMFTQEFADRTSPFTHHEETKRSIWDTLRILSKTVYCLFKWKWGTISNYTYKYSSLNDKNLTGKEELRLADAGIAMNSAYPLVLRPEREVKLILSFDFSSGNPFETVKEAVLYCKENHLPFPDIDVSELDKSKDSPYDCYVFQGHDSPTVMHFPLFNTVNCKDKVAEWREQYSTLKVSYKEQEVKNLLEAAKANVRNNKGRILQAMKSMQAP